MNRVKAILSSVALVVALPAAVATAAPAHRYAASGSSGYTTVYAPGSTDSRCPGTYDYVTTITGGGLTVDLTGFTQGKSPSHNLNTSNQLVYVNNGEDTVTTGGGNDCIVVSANINNRINAGDGNDYIYSSGMQGWLNGGSGDDTINDTNGWENSIDGGDGTDTCTFNPTQGDTVTNCEL